VPFTSMFIDRYIQMFSGAALFTSGVLLFAQANTRTATILVDELNSGRFQGSADCELISSRQ
jgi:hypothetical protein